MAKITRAVMKIFGSTAGTNERGVIGSLAAGSVAYSTDPVAIQALANYLAGWNAVVVGNNSPAIQDMNSLCFLFAYQLAYILQTGVPEWNASTIYFIGSVAQDGIGNTYVSLTDNNLNNALTSAVNWKFSGGGSIVTTTSSGAIATTTDTVRSNSTGGALTQTLPAIASVPIGKKFIIKDVGSGGFATTVKGNGSETIDGSNTYATALLQYNSMTVQSNGTTWDVV